MILKKRKRKEQNILYFKYLSATHFVRKNEELFLLCFRNQQENAKIIKKKHIYFKRIQNEYILTREIADRVKEPQ